MFDELMALSDRILVMNSGRVGEIIAREKFDGQGIRLSMHEKAVSQ